MAQTVNISIDQGSMFQYIFQLSNTAALNLSGANAMASLAPGYEEAANSSVTFTTQLIGTNVVISLTDTQTESLLANTYFPADSETWVYDVLIVDTSNTATRVAEGRARINPRVTQFP